MFPSHLDRKSKGILLLASFDKSRHSWYSEGTLSEVCLPSIRVDLLLNYMKTKYVLLFFFSQILFIIISAIISEIIYLYNIISIPEMVCHQASLIYLVLMAFVLGSQVYSFFLLNHLYFGKIMRFKRIYFLNMLRFYKVKGNTLQHNLPKVGARHGEDWEVQE